MRITRFERGEFLDSYWDYQPGQHVSFVAPTQNGKTTWAFELLKKTDLSWCDVPPTVLIAKPKDLILPQCLESVGYREIDNWPPRKKLWDTEDPEGYGLWPKHVKDVHPSVNNEHLASIFRPAMREMFWKGNSLCFVDELYEICAVLGLNEECTRHWTQGAGMGSALWTATQKPSGTQQGSIPTFAWNSPTHFFFGRDNVAANRKAFAEMGGSVDPNLISNTVMNLAKYEWLYVHKDGPYIGIIEAY